MTFDKWELKDFLTINHAVDYLSEKGGQSQDLMNRNRVRGADVLRLALDGRLPLVVDVPTGTEDSEGRSIEAGLWDLPIDQAAKQQIEYEWRLCDGSDSSNTDGIEGAWVERGKDRRQLEPVRVFGSSSAFGRGCILGVRKEALDALLSQETASNTVIEAEWRDVTITFLSEHKMQMKVGEATLPPQVCEELQNGFWNKHAKKEAKSWETLRSLAEQGGTIPTEFTERKIIETRMAEIRRNLRAYLADQGIKISDANPLPYNKHTRAYTATFSIEVGATYCE